MENHGLDQVVGHQDAPALNSLIAACGFAANSHAISHPSLPNYLALTSGSTHGIGDSKDPADHRLATDNIFSQLGAGRWRTLAESMPEPCYPKNQGAYVPRHNPATYYVNLAGQCANQDVALTDTPDLSAPFTLIVPNQRNNTHDTDVAFGDRWLGTFMAKVIKSPEYQSGRTVVVITYDEDEDDGNADNPIATVVVSPSTPKGVRSNIRFTHYSLLRTTEEILGLPLLGAASTAASMREAFNL